MSKSSLKNNQFNRLLLNRNAKMIIKIVPKTNLNQSQQKLNSIKFWLPNLKSKIVNSSKLFLKIIKQIQFIWSKEALKVIIFTFKK